MYTQCPHCKTVFEIAEDTLQASLGIVRCGYCGHRFDALESLSGYPPAGAAAPTPARDPGDRTPTLTTAVAAPGAPAPTIATATDATGPPAARPVRHADRTWFVPLADAGEGPPPGNPAATATDDATSVPELGVRDGPDDRWPVPVSADAAAVAPAATMAADDTAAVTEPDAVPMTESSPRTDIGSGAADAPGPPIEDAPVATNPVLRAAPVDNGDAVVADRVQPEIDGGAVDAPATLPEPQASTEPPAAAAPLSDAAGSISPQDTDDDAQAAPLYIPPRARRIHRSDWLFAGAAVALLLVLVAQLAWAERASLVRNPATQALALRACALLDCRLPPIRDLAKLQLLSRDVRPDPDHPGDLAITASIRNAAPFRQPWPVLVVRLTNFDNNVIAMRRFRPREYLSNRAQRQSGMAPGATAAIALVVASPGRHAVAFRFDFE